MQTNGEMNNSPRVLGMGCVLPNAVGCDAFDRMLRSPEGGPNKIDLGHGHSAFTFELPDLSDFEDRIAALNLPNRMVENALKQGKRGSLTLKATLLAAAEAWSVADIGDNEIVGLILAGNNLDPKANHSASVAYQDDGFAAPMRGMTWLDGHLMGAVSEMLELTGPGFQVGGSSAAGTMAAFQAMTLQRAGLADVWMVVAPPMMLSPVEMVALSGLGAMAGVDHDVPDPRVLCAPFDQSAQGFVPGCGAGAIVIGHGDHGPKLAGGAVLMDGHARTTPNADGEARVMASALHSASLKPGDIEYINSHGTASRQGDAAEIAALSAVFDFHSGSTPWVNSTKAIVGHCLTSAGLIELIATSIQLEKGYLHGNPNLSDAISDQTRFVGTVSENHQAENAICNSFAFGGLNSSIVLSTRKKN